jgi:hypothetical protein
MIIDGKIENSHVVLSDHVLNRSLDRCRLDGVDRAPRKSQKTIATALHKLIRDLVGDLNSLVLDGETTNGDNISTDVAACRRRISVRDLPGAALGSLPSAALGRVKDSVTSLLALSLDVLGEFGRPDPVLLLEFEGYCYY